MNGPNYSKMGLFLAILLAAERRTSSSFVKGAHERFEALTRAGYRPALTGQLEQAFTEAVTAENVAVRPSGAFDQKTYDDAIVNFVNQLEIAFRAVGAPARQKPTS